MKLLFVASDRMEFQGILSRATGIRPAAVSVDWARAAQLNGNAILLVANGAGPQRAAAAVDAAVSSHDHKPAFDAIISMGFCGALDERLKIADIIVATGIVDGPEIRHTGTLAPD